MTTAFKKRLFIPLWVLQSLASIAVIIFATVTYVQLQNIPAEEYQDPKAKAWKNTLQAVDVYLLLAGVLTLILLIIEIVLFSKRRLREVSCFWINLGKNVMEIPVFVAGIVNANVGGDLSAGYAGAAVLFAGMLCFFAVELAWASVLLHRYRRRSKIHRLAEAIALNNPEGPHDYPSDPKIHPEHAATNTVGPYNKAELANSELYGAQPVCVEMETYEIYEMDAAIKISELDSCGGQPVKDDLMSLKV